MAIKPVSTLEVSDWSHPKDKDPKTVFQVQPFSQTVKNYIADHAVAVEGEDDGASVRPLTGTLRTLRVRFGLVGVKNFPGWATTEHEDPVAGRKVPTDEFLNTIPSDVFEALADHINKLNSFTKEDAGKS